MQGSVRRFRAGVAAVVVGALVATPALSASPASADDTPLFVGWTDLLSSFSSGYV